MASVDTTQMEVAEKKNHYVEAVVDFTAGVLGKLSFFLKCSSVSWKSDPVTH